MWKLPIEPLPLFVSPTLLLSDLEKLVEARTWYLNLHL